ncbi:hypothetical protein EYF80_039340 [Liparis tanakae]|uniref:Uncharacterized protein n=1 Tax=Liparis tanakae TaxID=230148 RepID=A0A4Z2GB84_9TELE|nr:hypothetical protein EYF80_039340 [Liparis tanakae]
MEPRALLAHELQPCAYHSAVSVLDPGFMNVSIHNMLRDEVQPSLHHLPLCKDPRDTDRSRLREVM